jgi:spore coat protein CotH
MIEHPDDEWMAEWFDDDGALYKAESTGDYSYRGDDPDAYDEVFDQEAGKENTDLEPLMEFLEFINDSDDATFAAELDEYLDVESFATYLAMQELVDNFDDIDGPGNNSYLHWDADSGRFTVVPWDHNLAFGARNGPGGGEVVGGGLGGERPEGAPDLPPDIAGAPPVGEDGDFTGRGPGGGMGRSNVLVERYLAMDEFDALYEQQLESLRAALFDSGVADEVLAAWAEVVESSGLVDSTVIAEESATIATSFG